MAIAFKTFVTSALAAGLIAGTAVAGQAACREDVLTVAAYAFKDPADGKIELSVTMKSAQAKAIRLVDGKFGLRDALGGSIGSVALERDVAIPAGGDLSMTLTDGAKGWERLMKVNRADIVPYACISGVIYDDGTSEEF